jgi:hypothetical protein
MLKKTHTEVKEPQISVRMLADYMAASEQGQRTIARNCKYKPTAPVVQHDEARGIASIYVRQRDSVELKSKLDALRGRFYEPDQDFERKRNEHNADYVERFSKIASDLDLPQADYLPRRKFPPLMLRGTKVSFVPDLLVTRVNRTNKTKVGALMFRYAKGEPLPEDVAGYQSAFMFGYLEERPFAEAAVAERGLCLTVDAYAGKVYAAPGKAAYLFKEMQAACESIAERWPAIKPPARAVL